MLQSGSGDTPRKRRRALQRQRVIRGGDRAPWETEDSMSVIRKSKTCRQHVRCCRASRGVSSGAAYAAPCLTLWCGCSLPRRLVLSRKSERLCDPAQDRAPTAKSWPRMLQSSASTRHLLTHVKKTKRAPRSSAPAEKRLVSVWAWSECSRPVQNSRSPRQAGREKPCKEPTDTW